MANAISADQDQTNPECIKNKIWTKNIKNELFEVLGHQIPGS